ncbi:MAG: hypothetical protein RLZZ269_2115 [Actinomycetota bacterium]
MKGAGDLKRHRLLGTEFLGDLRRSSDSVGRAGDHDLSGCVEVGDPDVRVGSPTGDLHQLVVQSENGRHGPGVVLSGVVHRRGPFVHEANPVVESERARGRESGVLAETVAGAETRLEPESLDGVENHQARHERRELGVAGVAQFLGISVEQEVAHVATRDVGCLGHQFPTFVFDPGATHAGSLRTLAGEGEREHVRTIIGWPMRSPTTGR